MSYDHMEELGARRHEKVALYLTFENAVGLIAGALPSYIVFAHMPGLLRIILTICGAILGVIMTLDRAGMPIYTRLLWRIRGLIRLRMKPALITPEDLSGTPMQVSTGHARALRVGGAIQLAQGPALAGRMSPQSHRRVAAGPLRPRMALVQETPDASVVAADAIRHDEGGQG